MMKKDEKNEDGGTSLTEGASVSVSVPTGQLPHAEPEMQALYDDPQWREEYFSQFTKAELVQVLVRGQVSLTPLTNEQLAFERLSLALTCGAAGTWDELFHAAESLPQPEAQKMDDVFNDLDADARLVAAAYDYYEAMKNAVLDAGELEGDDAGYVAITADAWQMLKAAHAKAAPIHVDESDRLRSIADRMRRAAVARKKNR